MADTFTEFLNLTKPEIGGSRDAWGDKINADLDKVDVWAKATDVIAKAAVDSRGKKDGANNTVTQVIAGPVTVSGAFVGGNTGSFAEMLTLSKGATILTGRPLVFGASQIFEEAANFTFLSSRNSFRFVNSDYTQEYFAVDTNSARFKGFTVLHTGNLNAADYASKVSTGAQAFKGNISIANALPSISLNREATAIWTMEARSDYRFWVRSFDGGTNRDSVSFGLGGDISTLQFGDLNSRIEARANAYATDRYNQVTSEQNSRTDNNFVNKTNGARQTMNNDLLIARGNPGPRLKLDWSGVGGHCILSNNDGRFYLQKESGFEYTANLLYIGPGGDLWTLQLGDLNSRIEARASSYATDAKNSAQAYSDNKLETIRTTYYVRSADLEIGNTGNPSLWLHYGGVKRARWWVGNDGVLRWTDQGGTTHFSIDGGGGVVTQQLGDLNTRIEQRAEAFANDRLTTARNEYNGMTAYPRLAARASTAYGGIGGAEPAAGSVLVGFTSDNQGKAYTMYYRQLQFVNRLGGVGNAQVV